MNPRQRDLLLFHDPLDLVLLIPLRLDALNRQPVVIRLGVLLQHLQQRVSVHILRPVCLLDRDEVFGFRLVDDGDHFLDGQELLLSANDHQAVEPRVGLDLRAIFFHPTSRRHRPNALGDLFDTAVLDVDPMNRHLLDRFVEQRDP